MHEPLLVLAYYREYGYHQSSGIGVGTIVLIIFAVIGVVAFIKWLSTPSRTTYQQMPPPPAQPGPQQAPYGYAPPPAAGCGSTSPWVTGAAVAGGVVAGELAAHALLGGNHNTTTVVHEVEEVPVYDDYVSDDIFDV